MILTASCLIELMQLHKLQKPHALLFLCNNSASHLILGVAEFWQLSKFSCKFEDRQSRDQVMLVVKNPPVNAGDVRDSGSIPGLGRSPSGEHGNPLQCSCLENPMGRGAWRATVPGVIESRTRLKWLTAQSRPHHDNHNFHLLNACHGSSSNPGVLICISLFSPHYSRGEIGFSQLIFPEGKLTFELLSEATLWTEACGECKRLTPDLTMAYV